MYLNGAFEVPGVDAVIGPPRNERDAAIAEALAQPLVKYES